MSARADWYRFPHCEAIARNHRRAVAVHRLTRARMAPNATALADWEQSSVHPCADGSQRSVARAIRCCLCNRLPMLTVLSASAEVSTDGQPVVIVGRSRVGSGVDVIKVRPKSLSDAVGPVDDCARIRSHAAGLCGWICWLASWGRHCVSLRSHAAGLAVGICRSDVA